MSLLPSATETVCAVGAEGLLVGRSHQCDFSESVRALPSVTVSSATGALTIDLDLLSSLQPDLILAPDPCDVRLGSSRILRLNPVSIWEVFDDMLRVGEAIGRSREAECAMVALRERWWSAVDFVNPYTTGEELVVLEGLEPPIVAGNWVPALVTAAGARHSLNAAGVPSRRVRPEEIIEAAPTRVVIAPCGLGLCESRQRLDELTRQSWWPLVPAVLDGPGRVALVDGRRSFNRPGPRLVDSFEWLVGWLNDRRELAPPGFAVEIY